MSRRYVLALLTVCTLAMLGALVCGAVSAEESAGGFGRAERLVVVAFVLLGVLWVFRRADSIFALPVSPEARSCGLLLVFPALWIDVRSSIPGLGTAAIVGMSGAIYLSRLGGWFSRSGCALVLGSTGVLVPHVVALSLWWAYRGRWRLVLVSGLTFAVATAAVGLVTTAGACVVPPIWSGDAEGFLSDQSLWALPSSTIAPEARIWGHVFSGLVAVLALTWLLAFCRRRALSRPATLDPKEIAFASAAMVVLAPVLPPPIFTIFLPAGMITVEGWARSCVRPLRVAGGISFGLAVILAWCGWLLVETGAFADSCVDIASWPWFGAAAALVIWPLFHRRAHPENLGRAGAGTLGTGTSARPL